MIDQKTEAILYNYRQGVEKLARGLYLQALALRKELNTSKINEEDRLKIMMHVVNLITTEDKSEK